MPRLMEDARFAADVHQYRDDASRKIIQSLQRGTLVSDLEMGDAMDDISIAISEAFWAGKTIVSLGDQLGAVWINEFSGIDGVTSLEFGKSCSAAT